MAAYYNEIEPFCAEWLRNLIGAGHIAPGDVDERDIREVTADDVRGYTQCHFFAGIGGWSLALRMAGWADGSVCWTGSCPCQPFSVAGKREGERDERHLWPEFRRLIDATRPVTVFGEQVAGAAGREWLAGVRADLDVLGYAFGAADLCAAGVGAPHIRQRLWWVADAQLPRPARQQQHGGQAEDGPKNVLAASRGCGDGGLGDASSAGAGRNGRAACSAEAESSESGGEDGGVGHDAFASGAVGGVGDPDEQRPQGRPTMRRGADEWPSWAASMGNWLPCADGKARRIEPGIEPLAHGVSGRVGRLRAYGNAIVPQVAAEFIAAWMDCAP